jgi:hypothetical protein
VRPRTPGWSRRSPYRSWPRRRPPFKRAHVQQGACRRPARGELTDQEGRHRDPRRHPQAQPNPGRGEHAPGMAGHSTRATPPVPQPRPSRSPARRAAGRRCREAGRQAAEATRALRPPPPRTAHRARSTTPQGVAGVCSPAAHLPRAAAAGARRPATHRPQAPPAGLARPASPPRAAPSPVPKASTSGQPVTVSRSRTS